MCRAKGRSRGFTLIASLLVLVLLSAIAAGLLFMVYGAGQVGGNDLETNRAYYGAESGMELLTANLAALYQQSQAPSPAQITNLTNNPPDSTMISGMGYQEKIIWTPDANGNPASKPSTISSGPNAGLSAQIIPLTLQVTATRVASKSRSFRFSSSVFSRTAISVISPALISIFKAGCTPTAICS
jgi:type II secretory pathway pseudopilin PulG